MIVVADDDPLVQRSCRHCLESAGYKVTLARNGTEAVQVLTNNNVSTILVDVFMPEMDGIETLLSIRKQNPAMPVIVMSGGGVKGRMDFLDAATRFGANEVIKKPFTSDQLLSAVIRCSQTVWRL